MNKRIIFLLAVSLSPAFAAIPASTVWEARGPGADTNGAGFALGVGTPSPSASATLSVDATLNTKVTSSAHNFVAADNFKWFPITASSVLNIVLVGNGVSGCTSATVAFSSGGGSGATATVQVGGGVVTGTTMTAIGTSYTSAPTVAFTAPSCATLPTGYAVLEYTLGWYQILSTASNAATLDHSPGAVSSTIGTYSLYPGVDYSQNDNKNATSCTSCGNATNNLSTTDAVTNNTTTVTSATAAFTSDLIGNCLYLTGGGTTTGWYCVTAVGSGTSITVDRATGGAGGSSQTMILVGAVTISGLPPASGNSNKAWVKKATYQTSATLTWAQTAVGTNTVTSNVLIGYNVTRGDLANATNCANCPIVQLITNTGLTAVKMTGNTWNIYNLAIDCNSLGTSSGIDTSNGSNTNLINIKVSGGCPSGAVKLGVSSQLTDSEVTGMTSGTTAAIQLLSTDSALRNYIHDNTSRAISTAAAGTLIENNVFANMTSHICLIIPSPQIFVLSNTFYNCGIDAMTTTAAGINPQQIRNNVIVNSGGYGINFASAAYQAAPFWDGNCYFANALGNRHNMDDATVNATYGVTPRVNTFDKLPTTQPLTNPGSADFSLNSVATGGAVCRASGTPGSFPGLTQSGAIDMGAIQHLAVGGGASVQ